MSRGLNHDFLKVGDMLKQSFIKHSWAIQSVANIASQAGVFNKINRRRLKRISK